MTIGSVRTSVHHAKQTNTWVKPFPLDCNALDVISLKSISRSVESSLYPHLWANVCDPMMSEPEKEKKSYTLWWAAPSISSPLYTKPPFLLNWTPLSNNMPPVLNFKCFISPHPWSPFHSRSVEWHATLGGVLHEIAKNGRSRLKKKEKCGLCPVGYPSSIKLQLSYN